MNTNMLRDARAWRLAGVLATVATTALLSSGSQAVSYEVGFISGSVLTSSGAAVPNVRITARSLSSSGAVTTYTDAAGDYALEVPVGDYEVDARYDSRVVLGTTQLTIDPDQTLDASFTFHGAEVSASITADGSPASNARFTIREQGPSGCAAADTCSWLDPNDPGSCYGCTIDGRYYDCGGGECFWWDAATFSRYTDANGQMTILLPESNYELLGYSGYVSGQSGNVRVGDPLLAMVSDGVDIDAGEVAYETGFVGGTMTRNGEPFAGRIDATSLDGGGILRHHANGTGQYSLQLPLGSYELRVYGNNGDLLTTLGTDVLVAGSSQTLDIALTNPEGRLHGSVTADGDPSVSSRLYITERGPDSCDAADTCSWVDGNDPTSCYGCTLDGRYFDCGGGQCFWWDPERYNVYTNGSGELDLDVLAGSYDIDVYSGYEPNQSGQIRVAEIGVDVPAGGDVDLGTIAYQTGTVVGTLTNCGAPTTNMQLYVYSTTGGGSLRASASSADGSYQLTAPVGDYATSIRWENTELASSTASVTAGGVFPLDNDASNGQLRGTTLRQGEPAVGARAVIRERGPESCDIADSCSWIDSNDPTSCYGCMLDGRYFDCGGGQCYWWDTRNLTAYTGADGSFLRDVPPGSYWVDAYSASVSQQSGQILVGTVEADVNACLLSEVGASGSTVDPADSGSDIVLDEGVTLNFDNITGSGSVSFVSTSTPQGNPDPDIRFLGQYYDFVVEATFDGLVEVCLPYDPAEVNNINQLKIFHDVGGQWQQIDVTVDETAAIVCGFTDSFSWYAVGEVLNSPPTADAGVPIEISADATCSGVATLDGSGSSDPDGGSDIVSYAWELDGVSVGEGVSPSAAFGLGEHIVRLTVVDSAGESHTDTVRVTVVDDTAPTMSLEVTPDVLWPPNNKMKSIEPTWTVSDNCDADPAVVLESVTSATAEEGDIATEDGIELRASRSGDEQDGRTYTIAYSAYDAAGNTTTVTADVLVPHDQGAN